jgi:uncharacterized protein YndB with AHSA1/START domain/ketosteroid isomerase-like protein
MARGIICTLLLAAAFGCSESNERHGAMSESRIEDREAVEAAVVGFLSTVEARDTDAVVAAHSNDYADAAGNDKASRRGYFESLFAMGVLEGAKLETADMEIALDRDVATAAPVRYVTRAGTAIYEYKLKKESDGVWRILASTQLPATASAAPAQTAGESSSKSASSVVSNVDRSFLADAGRLVDRHAMAWIRRLNAPIDQVWKTVSTIEGLKTWWIVPPSKFELAKGGAFNHHWNNTVVDFQEKAYIDFTENTGDYPGTGGMRFELSRIDDTTTMFMFLDTWGPDASPPPPVSAPGAEQPGGPGTPWAGVAAGWHAMLDKLVHVIDGREPEHTYEELQTLYVRYLRDLYRWRAMVERDAQS